MISRAMLGTATLIWEISLRAPLAPTSSSIQAALRVRSRACSSMMRALAMTSALAPSSARGLPKATRWSERPHAVMNATGAEPALGDFETASRSGDDVVERYPDISEANLTVTEGRVVGAKHRHHTLDLDARSIERHQNHGMTLVLRGRSIGDAHEDEQPAMRVADPGTPPFQAVEDDMVSLDEGGRLHVRGIRRSHAGLRHAERGTNLAGQQRREPAILLRRRTILHQHFHIAGIGRVAVENLGGDRGATGDFRQGRILYIGEADAVLPVGKKQVPQAGCTRLRLQSLHNRRLLPAAPVGKVLQLRAILRLRWQDMLLHEGREALNIALGCR